MQQNINPSINFMQVSKRSGQKREYHLTRFLDVLMFCVKSCVWLESTQQK